MNQKLPHRIASQLALAAAVMTAACVGDAAVITGKGGGQHNTPYNCATGALDNAWRNARLSGDQTDPPCPYHVYMTEDVNFAGNVYGPKATTSLGGDVTLNTIRSVYDGVPVVSSMWQDWGDDPNNSDGRMVQFRSSYTAGYVRPDLGEAPWSHDSGTVTVTATSYGTANAYIAMTGSNDAFANLIVGPGGAAVGQAVPFRAYPAADTNAYTSYAWQVDGASVPGSGAVLDYAFSQDGNHTVTSLITDLDTTYTVNHSVKAYTVTISGPSSVQPFATCTWSGSASGGTSPYSYSWSAIGASQSGQYFDYTNDAVDGSSFTIQLTVTDGTGTQATRTQNVTASSNAHACMS